MHACCRVGTPPLSLTIYLGGEIYSTVRITAVPPSPVYIQMYIFLPIYTGFYLSSHLPAHSLTTRVSGTSSAPRCRHGPFAPFRAARGGWDCYDYIVILFLWGYLLDYFFVLWYIPINPSILCRSGCQILPRTVLSYPGIKDRDADIVTHSPTSSPATGTSPH